MSDVTVVIDGRRITADEDTTILEAATSAGIDIPTLCHHPDVTPYGGCRLCTVEIAKGGRSRLVASCAYQVEDGLEVQTESAPVVEGRRLILELLLARAPGVRELRDYGRRYGVDVAGLKRDVNLCILCGLCVNYCAEVKGKHAVCFIGRGVDREVLFLPDAKEECAECGECASLCPTGVFPSISGVARVPHFS